MELAVVGAGAWGLPAAAQAARRGHSVTLFDRYGPANLLASSAGASRIWRLAHPDRQRVRMAVAATDAWRRLEALSGETILLTTGILWRDSVGVPAVSATLSAEGVAHRLLAPEEVSAVFPGLAPNGRTALFQPEAGPVLADVALAAQLRTFEASGGRLAAGISVIGIEAGQAGVSLAVAEADGRPRTESFDRVVLAPGPWAGELLHQLGVELRLSTRLEQVTYLDCDADWERFPCWFEAPHDGRPGLYGMPTPGRGYKVGLDRPLRQLTAGDEDRTPDAGVEAEIVSRAQEAFGVACRPAGSQVCTWTSSPDDLFVIDRLAGGSVVLACGDSGQGFKFSALMGELLVDLADGGRLPEYAVGFGLNRFAVDDGSDVGAVGDS